FDGGRADVPAGQCVIQQGRIAPPAMRITVLVGGQPKQQTAIAKVVDEGFVGRFEEDTSDDRQVRVEGAVGPYRVDHRQAIGATHREVVGSERRRLVNQAGAVLSGDVIGEDDVVRAFSVEVD